MARQNGHPSEVVAQTETEPMVFTAGDLAPVLRVEWGTGNPPQRVVIVFARDVVGAEALDKPAPEGTVVAVSPKTPGMTYFAAPSKLVFEPSDAFTPGKSYSMALEYVGTSTGEVHG